MTNLSGYRVVDLSAELISQVTRLDATVEPGKRDVYDMPWIVEETINEKDLTIEHLIGGNLASLPDYPIAGLSGHMGSHTQLGIGHNDNWTELPEWYAGHLGDADRYVLRRGCRLQIGSHQGSANPPGTLIQRATG